MANIIDNLKSANKIYKEGDVFTTRNNKKVMIVKLSTGYYRILELETLEIWEYAKAKDVEDFISGYDLRFYSRNIDIVIN